MCSDGGTLCVRGQSGREVTAYEMGYHTRGRAVGYVRVFEKGRHSYEHLATRQIDLISGWAMENDADVLDFFFDIGVDATAPFQERSSAVSTRAR